MKKSEQFKINDEVLSAVDTLTYRPVKEVSHD